MYNFVAKEKGKEIMTKKEYEEQLALLKDDYEKKVRELELAFATSNNPVHLGCKVRTCHGDYLLVEKMVLYRPLFEPPYVRYIGTELKKDGTPRKNGAKGFVFQINVTEIDGKPYKYEV